MEEKPIVFICAILALLILVQIRRSFKIPYSDSFYWNFGYLKSIKLIYFSKINFEIHSKNNCVQLSGDEIVNIISNKLLFKKVEYNNEIISQVRTNIQPLCWAAGKLFLFLARSMGNENWKG